MEESGRLPIAPIYEHYTGHHVPDKHGWVKILCPVHEEQQPSATLHQEYQWIQCWACQFSGDAIDLIKEKEGVDFLEAKTLGEQLTGCHHNPVSQQPGVGGRRPPKSLSGGQGDHPGDTSKVPVRGRRRKRRVPPPRL